MKVLLFFVFLFFIYTIAHAGEVIEFKAENKYFLNGEEINIKFKFPAGVSTHYLVRPYISSGIVEIYNFDTKTWISSGNAWSELPLLQDTMRIKFKGISSTFADLHFSLSRISDGGYYELNPIRLINKDFQLQYLRNINKAMMTEAVVMDDTEIFEETIETSESSLAVDAGLEDTFPLRKAFIVFSLFTILGFVAYRSSKQYSDVTIS